MKTSFVILFVLALVSCSSDSVEINQKKEAVLDTATITDDKNIFGSWSMCATASNGIITQANVCSTMSFNPNGTGAFVPPSQVLEKFNWKLKNGMLSIFYTKEQFLRSFQDTTYSVSIKKEDTGFDMTITLDNRDISYYLSRQIHFREGNF